ncbi:hypothetical protein HMPREF9374_1094 [Desmospora sp. 8437]|nr:hypothetical protein HMPREF9374_1094 [Desmospora sp. 8437]
MGFTCRFRCSYDPKSLHVKPNPPSERLFHNTSRYVLMIDVMTFDEPHNGG